MTPSLRKFGLVPAAAAALILGTLSTIVWFSFQRYEQRHAAQLIERESYAIRNHLIRQLDTQFQALRAVARYWSDYGHLSRQQWDEDAQIELSHFHGFQRILWTDPARGNRYTTRIHDAQIDLGRRPSDEEWQTLQPLLEGTDPAGGEQVLGRSVQPNGNLRYRLQMPARGPNASGLLVASIDATAQLEQIFSGQLPNQAITVTWDDQRIYQRNSPAPGIPPAWRASGVVELPIGLRWQVANAPVATLARELASPTLPALLAAGWLIAILFGGLILLNCRSRERAQAAAQAERRYAKLNAELEARVHERTQDLETISQSVAHDIRGSLNVVSLNTHLLEFADASGASQAAIDRIAAANRHASEVVDRLGTFSSVAFTELARAEVDMNALARKVTRTVPEGVTVTIDDLPPCRAQPVLLEILFHNLIDNALKFTRSEAAPHITIRADSTRQPVVYCVADNGRGFDISDSEAIFKPFVRLSDQVAGGQGLGLAIVARIVRRHGGSIHAASQPGEGAAFYFDLGQASMPQRECPSTESAERI